MRIYAGQSDESDKDFLRRLHTAAPMTIKKLPTDNGSQLTDRFTSKRKKRSGEHAFHRECVLLGVEHHVIKWRGGAVQCPHQRQSGDHTLSLPR